MTDASVVFSEPPRTTLYALDVWGNATAFGQRFTAKFGVIVPPAGRALSVGTVRWLWLEPSVWLASLPPDQAEEMRLRLETILADDGALTEVSGVHARLRISGPGWRELLTIGSALDTEDRRFAVDCVAGTVIDHAPVRLDVVAADAVEVYTLPSYAEGLFAFWRKAAGRMTA